MASVTEKRPDEVVADEPERQETRFVEEQIRRTRRSLKLVDLTAGLITLVIVVLMFLLTVAVLEHWVIPGGWGDAARSGLFAVLLLGIAWYAWRIFWPLLSKPINPAYAALAIENHSPSLKNSLLNLLLLRDRRRQLSRQVYQAIEQQAAQRLAEVPLEGVVDRSAILRLGYVLVAVVALCALYRVLSPKDLVASAGRVLMPWSEIAVPSRVQIVDVQPGDTSVARGEQLQISAVITGTQPDEPVWLQTLTTDGQETAQEILMTSAASSTCFQCLLPGRLSPTGSSGVQQDLTYWIDAGDARSARYHITVFAQPTLVVDRIRYEYPAYTGYPTREAEHTGDLSALEGTIVTLFAQANQTIESAHVDFAADGRHDLLMKSDDRQATVSFPLELRDDRRTPRYDSYVLRYTTTAGRKNPSPPKYQIDVLRDYAPEIEILVPEQEIVDVALHDEVTIEVEARDPDFAVRHVSILGEVAGERVLKQPLLSEDHTGRFVGKHRLVPAELGLKVGDVLEVWGAAADNRRPEPNIAFSEHRKLRIIGPGDGGGGKNLPPRDDPQQDGQGENQSADGGEQQDGNNQQDQQGQSGGAGENGQPSDSDQQQQGSDAGGSGQQGDSPNADAQSQQGTEGQSSPDENQSGSENGAGGDSPSDRSDDSSQPGDQELGDGSSEPSDAQQKVSPEGDDDGSAFERISDHFAEQEGDSQDGAGDETDSRDDRRAADGTADGDQTDDGKPADGTEEIDQGSIEDAEGPERDRTSEEAGAEGEQSSTEGENDSDGGQEQDSTAPGGEMQEDQGPAGAGENQGENEGSPDPLGDKKPSDKQSDDAGGKQNDQESPAQGEGEQQSDTSGQQGGDRSGGGQEGAGQKAEDDGTGAAGEHQAADDGSGQAAEAGEGEAGSQPGDAQQAEGQTGESSGDQPGEGSQPGEQGGEQASDSDQPPGESAGDAAAAGQPPEAGGTGGSTTSPPPAGETAPGDEANLDYARKQTDLILEQLDDQLRKQEVDQKLLEKLGWSADELRRFVDRWKNLKSQADAGGPQADEALQKLDEALRNLGLGRNRRTGFQTQSAKDKLRDLEEAYRGRTPLEYQELLRKYNKGTASGGEE